MEFIADLHLHSRFSRATAKNLDLEHIYEAAQLKGITLVGTGDFTHPEWFKELKEKLEPAEEGLFKLKESIAGKLDHAVPEKCRGPVRFILQCEISSIYKKDNKVRKNHNLIYFPDLEIVEKFNEKLDKIGNIISDGRPILGLDAEKLLEIMLKTSEDGFLIPAHIWTPWFSMLGSKSGFDSIESCFGSLSDHIFAVETGLSSDPPMNWRVEDLDRVALISCSDAHSPMYMGRNASCFNTDLGYFNVRDALKSAKPLNGSSLEKSSQNHYMGTIDMYPEEGKYHYDGHRNCNVVLNPAETRKYQGICPVCAKPLTLGVLYRVQELASRDEGYAPERRHGYHRIVPLAEILSEICGVGPKTKKVTTHYNRALKHLGPELDILLKRDLGEIDKAGIPLLAQAVERMRKGENKLNPGFDGEFGSVKLFTPEEMESLKGELSMFPISRTKKRTADKAEHGAAEKKKRDNKTVFKKKSAASSDSPLKEPGLNPEQQRAVRVQNAPLLMEAGPGTGKTRTLTEKVASLILDAHVDPESILALTFTNKAAEEMKIRIKRQVPHRKKDVVAATFHGFCLIVLREYANFKSAIVDDHLRLVILHHAFELTLPDGCGEGKNSVNNSVKKIENAISLLKQKGYEPETVSASNFETSPVSDAETLSIPETVSIVWKKYQELLIRYNLVDFDDLMVMVLKLFQRDVSILKALKKRFSYIFVDEYQDINQGQYQLIRFLAGNGRSLCVIGDPDQSIYGFRGSDNRYFKQFEEDYPDTEKIVLRRNYRSTETILQASHQLITQGDKHNGGHAKEKLFSHIDGYQQIQIFESASEQAEAVMIGKTIEQLVGGLSMLSMETGKADATVDHEYSFSDFAVLYRTRQQAGVFSTVFEKAGIPFQTADRDNLFLQPGIRELISFMRMALEAGTLHDLETVMNHMDIAKGKRRREQLKKWFYSHNHSCSQALEFFVQDPAVATGFSGDKSVFPWKTDKKTAAKAGKLLEMLKKCHRSDDSAEAMVDSLEIIGHALKGLDLKQLIDKSDKGRDLLKKMVAEAEAFPDAHCFYDRMAMKKDPDIVDYSAEKVSLMTMHAAKGLEFKVVFIAGCEDGLIPFHNPGRQCDDIEEERRLFYVAMTRAEDMLYLCRAKKRRVYGKILETTPSPLLNDIEETLKDYHRVKARKIKNDNKSKQLELF